jgi:hypothetical protein
VIGCQAKLDGIKVACVRWQPNHCIAMCCWHRISAIHFRLSANLFG